MSETPTQTQLEPLEPQTQSQTQTTQQISTKVFYVLHNDDFYSTHLQPVIIRYIGRVYNAFMKERIGRPDMYYILGSRMYVKLWNDSRRNILVYISNMTQDNMFFARDANVVSINENIIYEYDTGKLRCPGKDVLLRGFDIIKTVDKLEPELIPPVFAVMCYRLL